MMLEEMKSKASEAAGILKVMSHPERLMVLCQLVQGEMGAGQLQESSALSQSAFSQHLTLLRKHQLVTFRKESQQVYYSLADPRIEEIVTTLHRVFCH
ncbi:ArsR/SmtB family transcription factor [Endozoicomonas sp.]|uniref:ArsR/SmtB family transcription factor n=1 Tax=Endozoicomonas sp. TaxID=1892382 RepID=UPI002883CF62|nr:metalloregulator ArsR/SmtB family transcription factor [Endozoicomonas sp.]